MYNQTLDKLNIFSALFLIHSGSRTYCQVSGVGADIIEDWVKSDLLQDGHPGRVGGDD